MYKIFNEIKLKKKDIKELVRIFTHSYMAYWSGQEIKYEQYYVDNLKVWLVIYNYTNNEYDALEKIISPLWVDNFRYHNYVKTLIRQNNFLNKVCKENNINFNKLFNKHFKAKYENNIYHYSRLKHNYNDIKNLTTKNN